MSESWVIFVRSDTTKPKVVDYATPLRERAERGPRVRRAAKILLAVSISSGIATSIAAMVGGALAGRGNDFGLRIAILLAAATALLFLVTIVVSFVSLFL